MAVRTHEVHPAIVHFPITLLPVAVGADLIGRATGSRTLAEVGRWAMPLTAATAALSAVTGLVAQEEVKAEGRAHDLLVTHRNMNLAFVGLSALLAAWRWKSSRASAPYLTMGLASLGAVSYSAYLGSKMVYEYGVGVDAAHGLRRPEGAPEIAPGNLAEAARSALEDVARGIPHGVDSIRDGEIVPEITRNHTPLRRLPGEGPAAYGADESIAGGDIRTLPARWARPPAAGGSARVSRIPARAAGRGRGDSFGTPGR
jgi:uncharacterized membrane protein